MIYGQWLIIWLDCQGLKRIKIGKLIMRTSGEEYVWASWKGADCEVSCVLCGCPPKSIYAEEALHN